MQEEVKKLAAQIMDRWKVLEKGQKIRLILVASLLAVVIGITIYMATRPNLVALSRNLDYRTTAEIMQALDDAGIYNTTNRSNTEIYVNERDHTAAQMYLVQNNIPSPGFFTFDDVLRNSSMSTSETITRASLGKERQSELEQAIMQLEPIQSATVIINRADDTVYFWEEAKRSSVAVVLTLYPNAVMTREQSESTARFLVASIAGLSIEDVQITDQFGRNIFDGKSYADDTGSVARAEAEQQREVTLVATIKDSIGPTYPDVKVITNLVFNTDNIYREYTTYAPPIPGSTSGMITQESGDSSSMSNTEAGEIPGVEANNNEIGEYQMGNGAVSEATAKSFDRSFVLNTEHGRIESNTMGNLIANQSSIAIIAYRYRTITEDFARRNNLLTDTTWERYKEENSEVVPIVVNEELLQGLRIGTGIDNLTLVAFEKALFIDAEVTEIKLEQIIILVILALIILLLAYGLIRSSQPDEITEIEPELSVEDLLVSTKLEESDDLNEIERMKSLEIKESETKRQVEKFVNEKPEAVAQLLRNWLNDEWE